MSYHKIFYLGNCVRQINQIELLIHNDKDKIWVNAVNAAGETPLHIAARTENLQLFRCLLPHYTNIGATDNQGNTVLHVLADGDASKYKDHKEERNNSFRTLVYKGDNIHERNKDGWTPIHYAAKYCHNEMLKIVKMANANFTLRTMAGETPLILVCKNMIEMCDSSKEMKTIGFFMKCKCDINATDDEGYSALHYAVHNCSVRAVKKLLQKGADVNLRTKKLKLSPLYFAIVKRRNLYLVKILLHAGASLKSQDNEELTPLQVSVLGSSLDIVKYLIKKYSDLNRPEKNLQFTPLHSAIYQQRRDLFQLLLKKGANVDGTGKEGLTPLHLSAMLGCLEFAKILIERGAEVNCRNKDQFTPLHLVTMQSHLGENSKLMGADAIRYGHENSMIVKLLTYPHIRIGLDYETLIQVLLRNGADVNALTSNGWSSLHFAAKLGRHRASFVKILLEYGANVDHRVPSSGYTALHFASKNDFETIARILIEAGADINALTQDGQTPVHLAAESCGEKVLKLLINCEANVDGMKTGSRMTPLNLALEKKYNYAAQILISAGADVMRVTPNGKSPIHLALNILNTDLLESLIEHDANVNYRDPHSQLMPLHVALQKNNKKPALILIKAGANVNVLTSDGKSPLSVALKSLGRSCSDKILTEVLKLLVIRGADVNYVEPHSQSTPLHVALNANRSDLARILIDVGADVNALTADRRSPLHLALKSLSLGKISSDVLKSMVHHGADVNYKEPYSQLTPLHVALNADCSDVARVLIDAGADVNALTLDERTPMHLALESNCKLVLNLLMKRHIKLNCQRRRCLYTLMYITAQSNNEDLIDNLDDLEKTPLLLAIDTQEKKEMRNAIFRLSAFVDSSNERSCMPVYSDVNNCCNENSACLRMCVVSSNFETYSKYISYRVLSGNFHEFINRQVQHPNNIDMSNYLSMLSAIELPLNTTCKMISRHSDKQICNYDKQCFDEVEKLKNYSMSDGMTLYNVLHMSPRRRRFYIKNFDLVKIECQFKIYYKLILAYYREDKIRKILMETVQSAFCKLTHLHWPITCLDEIVWNMDIIDVIATIEAAEGIY